MRTSRLAFAMIFLASAFSSAATLAANNPIPYVYQKLVPDSTAPGGTAFTLTVNGTSFVSGATVQWNGSPRTTTFVSSSQLTAAISSADISTAGTAVVTVFNPAPGGGVSDPAFFTVGLPTTTATFGSSVIPTNFPQFVFPVRVASGDFNGDGKQDIATLNIDCSVSIFIGNGDGTFQLPVTYGGIPTDRVPEGIVVGDFNGDGKLDLAVKDQKQAGQVLEVTVFPGNGDGTFGTAIPAIDIGSKITVGSTFVAADFNGDGNLDLATDCQGATVQLCVLNGNGDGTFTVGATVSVPASGGVFQTAVSDVNGDGKLDMVFGFGAPLGNPTNQAVLAVSLGNGDGTFGAIQAVDIVAPPPQQGNGSLDVTVADFDGDGIPDIAFAYMTCSNTAPCPGSVQVYAGKGDGTFQPTLPPQPLPALPPSKLIANDFNNDGVLDLAYGVTMLIGRGDGTFTDSANSLPQIAALAEDLNGDGFLDFVGLSPTSVLYSELRTPPDFTGFSSPKSQTVVAGSNTSYSVEVDPLLGWFTDVNLTVTGLPDGVTASFAPAKVPFGNGTSLLSVSTNSSTTPGTYTLTLTGTAGNLTHSTPITLFVNPATADFGGDITPGGQLIAAGQTAGYVVSVSPINGFTGDVTLNATGAPTGSIVTFNPPVIAGGSGTSVLSVIPPMNAPSGLSVLTITGTSGSLTHSGKRDLNVNNSADFGGFISPTINTVLAGQRAVYTVNVTSLNGYTGATTLSLSGLPANTTFRFTPVTIMGGAGTSSLIVTTTASTPPGGYTLTLSGQSGSDVKSTTIQLNVNSSVGDFGGSITPTSQSVNAGTDATYTVSIVPSGGFNGNVTLSLSNLPAAAIASFSPGNVISGGSGSVFFTIGTGAIAPGTYSIVVTGVSGGIAHSGSITLTVN